MMIRQWQDNLISTEDKEMLKNSQEDNLQGLVKNIMLKKFHILSTNAAQQEWKRRLEKTIEMKFTSKFIEDLDLQTSSLWREEYFPAIQRNVDACLHSKPLLAEIFDPLWLDLCKKPGNIGSMIESQYKHWRNEQLFSPSYKYNTFIDVQEIHNAWEYFVHQYDR